jgi:hypothetical protein
MVSDHLFDGGEIEWSLACKKAANNSRSVLRVSKSAKDHHLYRGAPFARLRSLPEPGDGVTIVPRAEAFGGAVQDLAQPIPGTVPIIDPHES